jgi:hypothetical protein
MSRRYTSSPPQAHPWRVVGQYYKTCTAVALASRVRRRVNTRIFIIASEHM